MRSIRLSFMVYFLALLAAALGAASLFAYQTAQAALEARRSEEAERVESQYKERCKKEKEALDRLLEHQLWGVMWRFPVQSGPLLRANVAGLLTAPEGPAGVGAVLAALPLAMPSTAFDVYRSADDARPLMTEIHLDEADFHNIAEGQSVEYAEVETDFDGTRSQKSFGPKVLPAIAGEFASEEAARKSDEPLPRKFDEVQLDGGVHVRRVLVKVSLNEFPWRPRRQPPPRQGPRDERRPPRPNDGRVLLNVYTQCAADLRRLDEPLQKFESMRTKALWELDEDTERQLKALRGRLLLVAGVTFAAAGVGCFGLVWLALAPLRRLSDAVSRISPRDFRLPLNARLPQELRPISARLQDTLDMLKRAFAREKQATADLSHELRTPLAAMMTTTELALRKTRPAEEYKEFLRDCQASARHMNRAVERLLTLARLDAGVDTLRPQPVAVDTAAQQCIDVVRPLAEARGLTLALFAEGDAVIHLTTDADKLREVLTNLLHNAIQYNRPGGSIEVHLSRKGAELEMAVRDTGVGIAPEARPHLFERFWRADPSRGEDGLHAGLGLAIVKGYVELMGGSITVESVVGVGSTLRVRLPVH